MCQGVLRAALLFCTAIGVRADDLQTVVDYLAGRGIKNAVVRPIEDDFVGRTFPGSSFFGVIFRQYPVAVQCPETKDLGCANVFLVREGRVEHTSTVEGLKFLFASETGAFDSEGAAADAASTWLRLSGELKQDLFYTFSAAAVSYEARGDSARVKGRVTVEAGGKGFIEIVMTLGAAGSFLDALERSSLQAGIRPICQATKLLDPDPVVRRMAEQDLLVMGRAAKPYLDQVRASAGPKLRRAIDNLWQRILLEQR